MWMCFNSLHRMFYVLKLHLSSEIFPPDQTPTPMVNMALHHLLCMSAHVSVCLTFQSKYHIEIRKLPCQSDFKLNILKYPIKTHDFSLIIKNRTVVLPLLTCRQMTIRSSMGRIFFNQTEPSEALITASLLSLMIILFPL